jgi:hypothetical protein
VPGGLNFTHFASHNTLKAVDGDEKTCWRPFGLAKKGDFFAIDFLRIQNNFTFALVVGHSQKLQHSLDVRVSFDGVWWISHRSFRELITKFSGGFAASFRKLVFDSRRLSPELQSFRYIAFNATYTFAEPFQVCFIRLLKNKKMNIK